MDENKKIEYFFKNRINRLEKEDGDWDRPEVDVFGQAQKHFPSYPQKKKKDRKIWWLLLIGLLLMTWIGYTVYLNKKINVLGAELEIAGQHLQQNKADSEKTKTNLSNKIKTLQSKTEKQINTIEQLTAAQNQLSQQIKQESQNVQKISSKNNILQGQISEQLFGQNLIIGEIKRENILAFNPVMKTSQRITNQVKQIQSAGLNEIVWSKDVEKELKISIHLQKPKLKYPKPKRFEIGLYLSSLYYEMPLAYTFSKLESEEKGSASFPIQMTSPRLHFAYALNSRLWLTTGFRKANYQLNKKFDSELIYDKENEYINADGKTVNEFNLNIQTGYSTGNNEIGIEIPQDSDIANGDILDAKWQFIQTFQFTQMPIGMQYFLGEQKWQCHLSGGLAWNKVTSGTYFIEPEIFYDNEKIEVEENKKKEAFESNNTFLSAYAGIGLNYQMTENWQIRTSIFAEQSFNSNKTLKDKKVNTSQFGKVLEIGLNYRWKK